MGSELGGEPGPHIALAGPKPTGDPRRSPCDLATPGALPVRVLCASGLCELCLCLPALRGFSAFHLLPGQQHMLLHLTESKLGYSADFKSS